MRTDNLYTTEEARKKMMNGIKKIADAVGGTMGTGGSNAIIEAMESPGHLMTNDGWTIANSIVLADPIEDMGRKILLEAINRANKASGDGSSTTCVLTAAIIEEGMKHMAETHPMDIKKQMEECLTDIDVSIENQKRPLIVEGAIDINLLEQVATVSAEDKEIGKRIAEIYSKIGPTGIIHWDVSKTADDSYSIGTGITLEGAGYYSPYMCDADENGRSTNQIRIKNPYVLVAKQKISSASEFGEIAQELNGKEVKDLVVFVDEIDPLIIPDLIKTRAIRGFRIAVVKMPVLFKDVWWEDLCKATGARLVDPAAGLPLKAAKVVDLGRCDNIVITKDDTFLDGIADLTAHIALLKNEGSDASLLRVARLNTKTARYFVGAHSDSALSYRRLKVEDAIAAAYQALNNGIVAGGGVALREASWDITKTTTGARVIRKALIAPYQQILANAGLPVQELVDRDYRGYDTKTGQAVDMFEAGIVDPTNIVLNACRNAIGVASAIITAKTVVTFPREEEPTNPMNPAVMR